MVLENDRIWDLVLPTLRGAALFGCNYQIEPQQVNEVMLQMVSYYTFPFRKMGMASKTRMDQPHLINSDKTLTVSL